MAMSASEARKRLFPLIEQVNDDQEPVEIVSKAGTAFLVSADQWRSLMEGTPAPVPRQCRAAAAQHGRCGGGPDQRSGADRSAARRRVKVSSTRDGWEDYVSWTGERTVLKRINRMIEEAARDPGSGIGKPQRLSRNLSGYWSRRITDEHRLVTNSATTS
jgi:toxin YoeB